MIKPTLEINRPISLLELLTAKEQRVKQQQALLNQYALPLVSLTVVMPGPVKLTPYSLFLFEQACAQLEAYYQKNQIECLAVIKNFNEAGPEGFFILNQDEQQLKQACIKIEDSHPLGRLWDIDVVSARNQLSISRNALGGSARKCLLCDNDAKACARSKAHSIKELIIKIEHMAEQSGYMHRN